MDESVAKNSLAARINEEVERYQLEAVTAEFERYRRLMEPVTAEFERYGRLMEPVMAEFERCRKSMEPVTAEFGRYRQALKPITGEFERCHRSITGMVDQVEHCQLAESFEVWPEPSERRFTLPELPTLLRVPSLAEQREVFREVIREEVERLLGSQDEEAAVEESPLYGSDGVKRSPGF